MNAQLSEKTAPAYGTAKQTKWITELATKLGYESVEAACKAYGLQVPSTVEEASAAISALQEHLPGARPVETAEPKRQRFLTALQLKRIDCGEIPLPDSLDEAAAWVLQRLAALRNVERALGGAAWKGVNNGGPILTQQLIDFFGSIETTASAFEVSVQTVRSWGRELPAARRFEAQVKTGNHVCA